MSENEKAGLKYEHGPKTSQIPQNQPQNTENVILRPILLEEYKSPEECPKSLQNVLTFLESQNTQSRIDIMVGLIFLLMAECGFIPSNYISDITTFEFNLKRVLALSNNVPLVKSSMDSKTYVLKLSLPNLQQFEVNMSMVCVSDDLIVNCFVKGIETGNYNLLLDPLIYFTSSNTSFLKVRFQQLNQLSLLIKNKIAFPVKYSILKQNGVPLACLEDLPTEVVLMIMRKLPLVNLVKFGNTNCRFRFLTQELFKKVGKKMQ